MIEVVFLFALSFIWITFATFSDIKTREIPNWLNFSLIAFALGFRFFYSLFSNANFSFFYQGLIGLGIFFVLSELFYRGKMFAGGDKKLMISLGAVIPVLPNLNDNLFLILSFLFLFFIAGAVYGIIGSVILSLRNFNVFKKGYSKLFREGKVILILSLFAGIVLLILSSNFPPLFYFSIFIVIFPYFYFFIKSVDESCMVKEVQPSKLTPGDWLYKDVKVGNRIIKATWDGLSKEEIKLLKKKGKVKVRYGIVFAPVFLLSFLAFIILFYMGILEKIIFSIF